MRHTQKILELIRCNDERVTTTRIFLTTFYFFKLFLSYLLMLVAMTFNVGLFISIILGVSLGHFFFASKSYIEETKRAKYSSVNSSSYTM
jgi:hypothetical protein